MVDKKPAYVIFKKKDKGIKITWHFATNYQKNEDGILDCSIPEFEIYFNAKSREEIDQKSLAHMRMFFEYYLEENNPNALRQLSTQLIRLGFRSTGGIADFAKLSRNKLHPTKFSSPRIEKNLAAETIELEDQLVA